MLISSSRRTPSRLQVNLDGKPIEQVHCAKYLGLLIDSHLTFSRQVEKVAWKVAGLTGALRRYRRKLDIKSRRMFYIALIQPHLEYASNAYVSLLTSSNMILRVAANSAIRSIYGLQAWTHGTSLYTRLHIANIDRSAVFPKISYNCLQMYHSCCSHPACRTYFNQYATQQQH